MAKLTRSGIAHNLSISPYKVVVDYQSGELTYVFSSELYKNKFIDKLEDNREKISKSLSNRFGFTVINNMLADVKLYITTETRGFLILGKEEYTCQSIIVLAGENLIQKS